MTVAELINYLGEVHDKDARVIARCTLCDRCNEVQQVIERIDIVQSEKAVFLEEEA